MISTRFTDLVGCRHPIVQTGMGWVSTPDLTTATCATGAFGILAGATLTDDELADAIGRVRAETPAPFGVNLRGDAPGLDRRLDACLDAGVPVMSFAGAPPADAIARLRDAGTIVIPTVGARRHAEKMLDAGASAVIAQGGEGGGHTGTIPTSLLVPDVVAAVGGDIPVIAAGGFRDGAGLAAALAWGADAIAMGTRFLLTNDSGVPDAIKARYVDAGVRDTVVSTAIDGAPQRVLRTAFVDRLERASLLSRLPRAATAALAFSRHMGIGSVTMLRTARAMRHEGGRPWSEVLLAANAPMMVRSTMVHGDIDGGVLPAGQAVGLIDDLPSIDDLVTEIVADARTTIERLWRTTS